MRMLKAGPLPFIKKNNSAGFMLYMMVIVLIGLITVGAIYLGTNIFLLALISVASALFFELFYSFVVNEKLKIENASSVVTALMFVCLCGAKTPLYVPIIAMFFAIVVVKMMFGGYANNIVNPAGASAIIVSAIFGAGSSAWQTAIGSGYASEVGVRLESGNYVGFNPLELLLKRVSAPVGAVLLVAVLVGFVLLVIFGVVKIRVPIMAIGFYVLTAFCLTGFDIVAVPPFLMNNIVIFVACFMLVDFTTSPNCLLGDIIYSLIFGVLCGVFVKMNLMGDLSAVYALVIANLFTPLLDRVIYPKYFGKGVQDEQ
ncbi:MAG: RnfABCDGE type electron transport complex subunit D [Clostridia bacterium]|nr:RnfABCDGE type electron transport complex subunit D [Clostridia bacterium]